MYEINNQKFGAFLLQLRKEKGMTQRELAEKLYVSDKAVSKWERGLSLPDISLLQPLAELMDVSVTELLSGQFIPVDRSMTVEEVEPLIAGALHMRLTMTDQERALQKEHRRRWCVWFAAAVAAFALEVWLLRNLAWLWTADRIVFTILPPLMAWGFGVYFILFSREKLPEFYDQYRLNFVSDGIFRMNIAGVYFNNRNWPRILNAMRTWTCVTLTGWIPLYCGFYLLISLFLPEGGMIFATVMLLLSLFTILGGLFIPVVVIGKKYE